MDNELKKQADLPEGNTPSEGSSSPEGSTSHKVKATCEEIASRKDTPRTVDALSSEKSTSVEDIGSLESASPATSGESSHSRSSTVGGSRSRGTTHRVIALAALVALALILSFIESRIPSFLPIPGVKLGLANIVVVFCLYRLRAVDAVILSVVRVCLASLLFGSLTSFLYGLAGACVSLLLMLLLKRAGLGTVAVSTLGGVSHNIAQIAVASLLLETNVVGYYLPFLVLSGTLAGIVIGVAGGLIEKKIPKLPHSW